MGRPGLPVAQRRAPAAHPNSGVAGSPRVSGGLLVPAPVRRSPQLAGPEPQHGPDGGHPAGRGGGDGLRPSGSNPRPGDGPSPHGVGPDRGAGLLQAQLRLAHLQPETGRRHRRTGSGLGLLRRCPQVPGHRQLPRRSRGRRRAAPQAHPGLPGILPAPGLHHRPRPGETPQGQAPRGAGRPVRPRALLQGQQLRQSGGDAIGCQAVVPGRSRIAGPRHHPAPAAAGLPR